jgi:hypothetical protein
MRDYFKNLLQNLDKLTGIKQYEKLCQTKNPKEEIKTLLDILCRVCDQFPYIPDEDKKRIIQDATIADQEFIGLNAKIIFKWLNMKREFYMKDPKDEVVIHPDALTGEAMQRRLDEWREALAKVETNYTQKVDVYQTIREQWKPREGTPVYSKTGDNLVTEHQMHVEYLKANYNARTGKPLPTWVPEHEWNKMQDV